MYLSVDRMEFVKKEATMLLEIRHIKEIYYPERLNNVVLAPKGTTWRMCIDYIDLNEACPMDRFPLPNIDRLVDKTIGCKLMSFMDAYRGYHQTLMYEDDAEKTTFTTLKGIFCYLVVVFVLKNSSATYSRIMVKLFITVLDCNMEAYVDDIIIKATKPPPMLRT